MKKPYSLKNFFYFNKKERQGLNILVLTCLFFAFIPISFSTLFYKNEHVDFSQFQEEIALFYASEAQKELALNIELRGENKIKTSYFSFNPNTASKKDFVQLGLSPKVAQTIINYRNKGGKFKKKEDFKRIYGISESNYTALEKYIFIPTLASKKFEYPKNNKFKKEEESLKKEEFSFNPNTVSFEDLVRLGIPKRTAKGLQKYREAGAVFRKKSDLKKVYNFEETDYKRLVSFIELPDEVEKEFAKKDKPKFEEKKKEVVYIDINKASAEEWQKLNGIGAAYAKWIVNERDKLGGFADKNQIGEIYNFPDSTFQKIKPFLKNSPITRKIVINKISEEALKKHPLLSWNPAKRIIAYRKQHGNFKSMTDFRKMPVFKEDFFKKIEPYLDFSK